MIRAFRVSHRTGRQHRITTSLNGLSLFAFGNFSKCDSIHRDFCASFDPILSRSSSQLIRPQYRTGRSFLSGIDLHFLRPLSGSRVLWSIGRKRERINELWKDLLREALRFQNMRRLKWSLNSFSSSSFCVHGNIWNGPLSFHNTRLIIPCNPCWVFDSNYQELKERPLTLKCISIFSLLASHL